MERNIISAGITLSGPNHDLKIALIAAFVIAVAAGIWSNSRIRARISESGLPDWHPIGIIGSLRWSDILIFVCCWTAGAAALMILQNIQ